MIHSHHRRKLIALFVALPFASMAFLLKAHVDGADPRLTTAPGDDPAGCTSCHIGTGLNQGPGSVKITLPGGNTYTPGVKQRITVTVSDPAQRRWGFELTARLVSNLAGGQAGDLSSTDNLTQVICENGRLKPCAASSPVQFATHTLAGTRLGTAGGASFEVDWTPPDSNVGNIRLYAAGNAANGNTQETGDRIYTTNVELTPAVVTPPPVISSEGGVRSAASSEAAVASGTWITITGTDLATTTRTWTPDELASGSLPLALDEVSVTVNGKPAFVQYVSPTQVNALVTADDTVGPVEGRVTSHGGTSDPVNATLQAVAPALFTLDGKYLPTAPGENNLLDKSGRFFAAADAAGAVKPGDTIVLFGTGFGATDPAVPVGQLPDADAPLAAPVTVTIGDVPATVSFAGLVAKSPRIYQLKVQVPADLADGDQPVVVETGGVRSPGALLKVAK
jgi:uncharacterized protein (TIGR03437 family)